MTMPDIHELLEEIAKANLNIETLEIRNSDGLDFHDVSVWGVKEALMQAYRAGYDAGRNPDADLLH